MNLRAHEHIVREALGARNLMGPQALNWIITANKRCDLHQFTPELHFDNAPNREVLCQHWNHGLKTYIDQAIAFCAPVCDTRPQPRRRKQALYAFGAATHALADFYAHTNWVELGVMREDYETLAPLLGDTCRENDFPAGLQSGYFSLWNGIHGCPRTGPPPGYQYCHLQLAKDYPDKGHGADYIHGAGCTYFELAMVMAREATLQLWKMLHYRILTTYGPLSDAEALFHTLSWTISEVVQYQDVHRLCYIRRPEGLLIGLTQELG